MIREIKWENGKSCFDCKHFKTEHKQIEDGDFIEEREDFFCCEAFPDGIPDEVFENGHDKPRPDLGQNDDIVFISNDIK